MLERNKCLIFSTGERRVAARQLFSLEGEESLELGISLISNSHSYLIKLQAGKAQATNCGRGGGAEAGATRASLFIYRAPRRNARTCILVYSTPPGLVFGIFIWIILPLR